MNSVQNSSKNKNSFTLSAKKLIKSFLYFFYCYFVAKNDTALAKFNMFHRFLAPTFLIILSAKLILCCKILT